MTKIETLNRFLKNPEHVAKAREAVKSEWFCCWIEAALLGMGEFAIDAPMSIHPHIQDRRDGGKTAINKFIQRLTFVTEIEHKEEEGADEYVGFATEEPKTDNK